MKYITKLEGKDGKLWIDDKEVLRGWESFTGWYWFALEEDRKQDSVIDGKIIPNDTIYFGYVQGNFCEYGYFSLAELESLKPKVWEIPQKNLSYSGRRGKRA